MKNLFQCSARHWNRFKCIRNRTSKRKLTELIYVIHCRNRGMFLRRVSVRHIHHQEVFVIIKLEKLWHKPFIALLSYIHSESNLRNGLTPASREMIVVLKAVTLQYVDASDRDRIRYDLTLEVRKPTGENSRIEPERLTKIFELLEVT